MGVKPVSHTEGRIKIEDGWKEDGSMRREKQETRELHNKKLHNLWNTLHQILGY
jgi:hypothetical protein